MVLERLAKQWIAGSERRDAVERVLELRAKGAGSMVHYLGEDLNTRDAVERHVQEYFALLDSLDEEGVEADLSVKATQLGLVLDRNTCLRNLRRLADRCTDGDRFLWIDMEGSRYVGDTVDLFLDLPETHPEIGVAIQAYLRRTSRDLERIVERGGTVRLVKGAYRENRETAYHRAGEVEAAYAAHLGYLLEHGNVAVATHDPDLLSVARDLADFHGRDPEFQTLLGFGKDERDQLIDEGREVSIYVPYGEEWLPYSVRRIEEKPETALRVLRSLTER